MTTEHDAKPAPRHPGSCHCRRVTFEVETDLGLVTRCNCTICQRTAQVSALVKRAAFRLLTGASELTAYPNAVGSRYFCKHCGIQCFGRGHLEELGGDFVSVNVNALDDVDAGQLSPMHWDGRHDNWHAGLRPTPWPVFTQA